MTTPTPASTLRVQRLDSSMAPVHCLLTLAHNVQHFPSYITVLECTPPDLHNARMMQYDHNACTPAEPHKMYYWQSHLFLPTTSTDLCMLFDTKVV